MKEIFLYLRNYYRELNKIVFVITTGLVAILIVLNYSVGIDRSIKSFESPAIRLLAFFLLYMFVFTACYGIHFFLTGVTVPYKSRFFLLLLLCPLLFAAKTSLNLSNFFTDEILVNPWNRFLQIVLNWPLKCVLVLLIIYGVWTREGYEKPVAGMNRHFNWKPYLLLLLCALPLLAISSSMNDFHTTYPKAKNIAFIYPFTQNDFFYTFLYELAYGTDFLTIEAFFRGFVVLAFVRYAGKDVILPMAAFYCAIHFGKPLFECITSYIGGIILGVIVYNTRSIWGGLIVHLGMAWLMEFLYAS